MDSGGVQLQQLQHLLPVWAVGRCDELTVTGGAFEWNGGHGHWVLKFLSLLGSLNGREHQEMSCKENRGSAIFIVFMICSETNNNVTRHVENIN